MVEIFKDIENYEGLYQVSNLGKVKSVERIRKGKNNSLVFVRERILKQAITRYGYKKVILHKNGKMKNHLVHRLVAKAFLDNPNNLTEVNHKNEIKTDNRVENLEFCTVQYNNEYSKAISVLQFTKNGEFVKKYKSISIAERELGIEHSNIIKCCKGQYKAAGGYIWKYAVQENNKVA